MRRELDDLRKYTPSQRLAFSQSRRRRHSDKIKSLAHPSEKASSIEKRTRTRLKEAVKGSDRSARLKVVKDYRKSKQAKSKQLPNPVVTDIGNKKQQVKDNKMAGRKSSKTQNKKTTKVKKIDPVIQARLDASKSRRRSAMRQAYGKNPLTSTGRLLSPSGRKANTAAVRGNAKRLYKGSRSDRLKDIEGYIDKRMSRKGGKGLGIKEKVGIGVKKVAAKMQRHDQSTGKQRFKKRYKGLAAVGIGYGSYKAYKTNKERKRRNAAMG